MFHKIYNKLVLSFFLIDYLHDIDSVPTIGIDKETFKSRSF
ncbi:MAG: hypothetical protein ACUVUG_07840 [Candidatus Aminicenantia bacterium]